MNKIIPVLIVIAIAIAVYYERQQAAVPEHPVYTELTAQLEGMDRSIDIVVLVRSNNFEECKQEGRAFIAGLCKGLPKGVRCNVDLPKCSEKLAKRKLALFDDRPTTLSYLSYHGGGGNDRDARIILWGMTASESEAACGTMKDALPRDYSGTATCIAPAGR